MDPVLGSATSLSELGKPRTSVFSPIHLGISRHCLGTINIEKTTDQTSPNHMPREYKFLPEACSKRKSNCSICAPLPDDKSAESSYMEQVSQTRFVLSILPVGLKSGYGTCTVKVLWYRNTGERRHLWEHE